MGAVGVEDFVQCEGMDAAAGVGGGKTERILVSVRLRPLNAKELAANDPCDWECINDSAIIYRNNLPEHSMPPTAYTFDRVFRCDCPTKVVYGEGVKEVALSVVSGINATIFAYGQTSSGKTYTMSGITEYTVADIYDYINRHKERAFVLKFSAIEIYNEAVKDLLSTDSTPLRLLDDPEKGTIVEKLTAETLRDWNHLKDLIVVCEAHRKIGETSLNEASSRSHQILRLTVESFAHEFLGKDNSSALVANVNFVDLAGSERACQALSAGTRLKEGCHINRSLLTLGTVIRKLSKGRNSHIPYRDSKLTRILQPALGGNARTAIICTICPARSHVEQSRNTLVFASCAKEVTTNAQVNIVMSDKALVKHLQKELARLESEMRYPGLSPNLEALLKDKDAQIKKMEKEIKELIQQRDLAYSRLDSLLKAVDTDRVSSQWECYSQISTPIVPYTCGDGLYSFEPSDDIYHTLESVSTENSTLEQHHYLEMQKKDIIRPEQANSHYIGLAGNRFEEHMDQNYCEGCEDHCKEVPCIKMNEIARDDHSDLFVTKGHNSLPHVNMTFDNGEENDRSNMQVDLVPLDNNNMTLEQHLQNVRKKFPEGLSPWSSVDNLPSSRGLRRTRSCRSTLMSFSSWSQDIQQNCSTPPSRFLKDLPGRPDRFRKRISVLNYDAETDTLSREGSQSSKFSTFSSLQKSQKLEVSEGEITGISDFVAELKELAKVQYQKQFFDDQGTKRNVIEENEDSAISKDVRLDTALLPVQSPSQWPKEFGKHQQEIIELWHQCNVSLVHRTYFFILFKGDPMDLIYIEVELRRLSFLKNALISGNPDRTTALGHLTTFVSSIKKLRREREMLCRQMHKKLPSEERESLYRKWGIALDSKQRGMQLAKRLWIDTKDLEHVRESASTVAKVIGLPEHGHALKEMYGLSFTPQQASRRSRSWLHGLSTRR